MKKVVVGGVILAGILGLIFCGFILYVYLVNRNVDQTIARKFTVEKEWVEISPNPPLTAFRKAQELAVAIPGFRHDQGEKTPLGQFRLPDGRVISLRIEGIDQFGNKISFRHKGFTMSKIDLITYSPERDLGADTILTQISIRSNEPFECDEIFWRNIDPK